MKYEMEVNEFTVDIVKFGKNLFHRRTILTVGIDEDPTERQLQMQDLQIITAALNAYENGKIAEPNHLHFQLSVT